MRTKLSAALIILLCSPAGEALACSVCYGDPNSKSTQHMAVAIWFMMAAVMTVLGGIGAFSYHIWRHANTPLEPHQKLVEEDLEQYD